MCFCELVSFIILIRFGGKIFNDSKLGILRYKVDFQSLQADELLDDIDLDDY